MQSTIGLTKQEAVLKVLERNFGKRVPTYKLIHPFSEDDPRKMVAEHRRCLTTYRRKNPKISIVNKKYFTGEEFASYYMMNDKDADFDKLWSEYISDNQ